MKLDDIFTFGKYKGLTLQEVFEGKQDIDPLLIKEFIRTLISLLEVNIPQDLTLNDVIEFEVKDNVIIIKPKGRWNNIDWEEKLTGYLSPPNSLSNTFCKLRQFVSNIEYNKLTEINGIPLIASGDPYYVEWCIKKIDSFFIEPVDLEKLTKMNFYWFDSIKVKRISKFEYKYTPLIITRKWKADDKISQLNYKKYLLHSQNLTDNKLKDTHETFDSSFNPKVEKDERLILIEKLVESLLKVVNSLINEGKLKNKTTKNTLSLNDRLSDINFNEVASFFDNTLGSDKFKRIYDTFKNTFNILTEQNESKTYFAFFKKKIEIGICKECNEVINALKTFIDADGKKIFNFEYDRDQESNYHGPESYGYNSWDDMAFYTAFEGDIDSWNASRNC